jgi:hypothetical protein
MEATFWLEAISWYRIGESTAAHKLCVIGVTYIGTEKSS